MTLIRTGTLIRSLDDYVRYGVAGVFSAGQEFGVNDLSITGSGGGRTTLNSAASTSKSVEFADEGGTANVIPTGQRKPFTTRFAARLSDTSTQTLTNNSWTAITGTVFNSEIVDSDNAFSGGTFTCPTGGDGEYYFVAAVELGSITSSSDIVCAFYKNGALEFRGLRNSLAVTKEHSVIAAGTMSLAAGDTVNFRIYQSSGANRSTRGSAGAATISGWNVS